MVPVHRRERDAVDELVLVDRYEAQLRELPHRPGLLDRRPAAVAPVGVRPRLRPLHPRGTAVTTLGRLGLHRLELLRRPVVRDLLVCAPRSAAGGVRRLGGHVAVVIGGPARREGGRGAGRACRRAVHREHLVPPPPVGLVALAVHVVVSARVLLPLRRLPAVRRVHRPYLPARAPLRPLVVVHRLHHVPRRVRDAVGGAAVDRERFRGVQLLLLAHQPRLRRVVLLPTV